MADVSNIEFMQTLDLTKIYIDPFLDDTVSEVKLRDFFQILITWWYLWPFHTMNGGKKELWWQPAKGQSTEPQWVDGFYNMMEITDAGKRALETLGKNQVYEELYDFLIMNRLSILTSADPRDKKKFNLYIRNIRELQPGRWVSNEPIIVGLSPE